MLFPINSEIEGLLKELQYAHKQAQGGNHATDAQGEAGFQFSKTSIHLLEAQIDLAKPCIHFSLDLIFQCPEVVLKDPDVVLGGDLGEDVLGEEVRLRGHMGLGLLRGNPRFLEAVGVGEGIKGDGAHGRSVTQPPAAVATLFRLSLVFYIPVDADVGGPRLNVGFDMPAELHVVHGNALFIPKGLPDVFGGPALSQCLFNNIAVCQHLVATVSALCGRQK